MSFYWACLKNTVFEYVQWYTWRARPKPDMRGIWSAFLRASVAEWFGASDEVRCVLWNQWFESGHNFLRLLIFLFCPVMHTAFAAFFFSSGNLHQTISESKCFPAYRTQLVNWIRQTPRLVVVIHKQNALHHLATSDTNLIAKFKWRMQLTILV